MSLAHTFKSLVRIDLGLAPTGALLEEAARGELADLPPAVLEPEASTASADGLDVSDKHVVSGTLNLSSL